MNYPVSTYKILKVYLLKKAELHSDETNIFQLQYNFALKMHYHKYSGLVI